MSTTKDTGVTVDAANVINDILPCCAQGVDGRDLLAQAEYAADVQRTIGHQPGIARQELANKQARQVSHMSAGLAQFLARRYAGGVKDDGDLDKVEVALVSVIMGLLESKLPGIATEEANGICHPDGVTIKIDETGQLSALRYELGEFYLFRHPTLKHGMQSCYGGLLTNVATTYSQIWAYLQTTEGQLLCKTESQWQELSTHIYYILADGTNIGFNGVGGVPYYVQDLNAGTLRLPDIRGIYAEPAGYDSLVVGGVHIDMIRNIVGQIFFSAGGVDGYLSSTAASGPFTSGSAIVGKNLTYTENTYPSGVSLNTAHVVITGNANKPRGYGDLPCAFLGQPTA